MLETIREFGVEQLEGSGEGATIRSCHAAFFLDIVERLWPGWFGGRGVAARFDRVEVERDNLRAALTWADEHGEFDVAARMAHALRIFWAFRGPVSEGCGWLERVLAYGSALPDQLRVDLLYDAGYLAFIKGDLARAVELEEQALALAQALDSPVLIAGAMYFLGVATLAQNRDDDARRLFEEALPVFRALGVKVWTTVLLDNLGVVARRRGDAAQAANLRESPVAGAGVVYISTSDGAVHAIDAATGRLRWRGATAGHPAMSPVLAGDALLVVSGVRGAAPVVTGDTVFVGGGGSRQYIQSLDAHSGVERWRFPLAEHGLYALDAAAGAERWQLGTRSSVSVTPVVAGDRVYVVEEALHKVDAATGGEEWHVPMGADAVVKAAAVLDGKVVLAVETSARPVDSLGVIYGWIYAYDDVSGAERWQFPTGGGTSSAPVVSGGTVFIGGYDGNLYALDAVTGEERWQLELDGHLESPVVNCGVLYVGSYDGSLVAVANA